MLSLKKRYRIHACMNCVGHEFAAGSACGRSFEEFELMMSKADGKTPFLEFFQQVRREIRKVTWPTSREVLVIGFLVFCMVLGFSLFFLVVDQALGACVGYVLNWGR